IEATSWDWHLPPREPTFAVPVLLLGLGRQHQGCGNLNEASYEGIPSDRLADHRAALHYAAIIESSDDAILSKDLNGVITRWNRGAEHIFGYVAEEAVGQSVTILIPPDRHDEEPMILDRIRRGERIEHYETVRQRKDGSLVNISLTVSPIKDGDGKIVGASKI